MRARFFIISLFVANERDVTECHCRVDLVADAAINLQALLIMCPRGSRVTSVTGYRPEPHARVGHAGQVVKAGPDLKTLLEKCCCLLGLSAASFHGSEVVEGARE